MLNELIDFIRLNMNEFLEYWTPMIMIMVGIIVFLLESFGGMRAAYGRYNKKNIGLRAPVAWLVQESPSFLVPFILIISRQTSVFDVMQRINTNRVLLFYFMIHYFNRFTKNSMPIKQAK